MFYGCFFFFRSFDVCHQRYTANRGITVKPSNNRGLTNYGGSKAGRGTVDSRGVLPATDGEVMRAMIDCVYVEPKKFCFEAIDEGVLSAMKNLEEF